MARKTAIHFETTQFEQAHAKQPRGFGMWAFIVMNYNEEINTFFTPSMNYADARVWARAHIRDNFADGSYSHIEVGS